MVPIGKWLGKHNGPLGSLVCSSPIEALRHCLWDCPQAQKVWDRVTRLLAACEVEGTTSWSVAAWIDHSVDRWTDTFNVDSWCYVCMRGKIANIPGHLDVDRRLHPVVCMESALPKGLSGSDAAPGGSDHGHIVCTFGRNGGTRLW